MAMGIKEASAANVLLRELYVTTSGGDWSADKRPTQGEVHEACKALAESAYRALGAGVGPDRVTPRRRRKA